MLRLLPTVVNPMRSQHQPDETDPRLNGLLRDALSPESIPGGVPADLADRIVAATGDKLVPGRPSVIARIGLRRLGAVAAAVFVAVSVGILITAGSSVKTARSLNEIEADLQTLAAYPGLNEPIDQELRLLEMEMDLTFADAGFDLDRQALDDELNQWEQELEQDQFEIF